MPSALSTVAPIKLHPLIDQGIRKGSKLKTGGKLSCTCAWTKRVVVELNSNVAHNHACGCSKCWKPPGAVFAVIGVVPRDKLTVTHNADKLTVVDSNAAIQRHACKQCGVHMYGRIEQMDNPFYGLDFVHVELSDEDDWQEPQFAGFVSSIIEQGFHPDNMWEVRQRLKERGLETYDTLSPELMDMVAADVAKKSKAK